MAYGCEDFGYGSGADYTYRKKKLKKIKTVKKKKLKKIIKKILYEN